ncbi:MAG TPA: glycoside hydrolase family 38 C-terminal domain-containing protein [Stackebrandtia sp.]|uniref:glycoside hydrolase family 38 N-terminal domain-containing protein n=1 Tax=Stackebrandtia sp. TaxID=2023065 RepID=UPI002D61C881|nr:glycoside hydrolase family 38 C-terminal domain-containing protein [Stackebrandtia sp.]HZE40790.1 glycoside hydrolase family 38 C-terminal domain-containing protein [Stackebrandtia sp.]
MAATIVSAEATELFVGSEAEPRQVLRVKVSRTASDAGASIEVSGDKARGAAEVPDGDGETVVEVPLDVDALPGATVRATVTAGGDSRNVDIVVAEPGWTMYMVSHFHYDPVWWNTQAAYTQTWELQGNDGTTRPVFEHNGFNLVRAHLDMAESDPDYMFVLAEVDYLKPFWDVHPEYRDRLRELIAQGRVEVMGGTYNEPNTNLTGSETTIRNLVYGVGYQKSIMGADPQTAWQLDVFGHDPQFPGLVHEAGLTSSSWARGPFHQWGPILNKFNESGGDSRHMQFPAEFEWISPSGRGVLTHYMPYHYSAGWWMDSAATLGEACQKVYELFLDLKPVASTRNTLLPVGTDYTPPNKWVTGVHREWNAKYVWPRFVCGNPRDFFAAVHAELTERGIAPSPQTRDMNPLYTGKDVSYIDTKQAQRAAEAAAADAEKLATFASLLGLGWYPEAALDKVWRQLAFGAHHDGITGSESDQVYIDLVTGWREAHDLAAQVRDTAMEVIASERVDTSGDGEAVTVFNTLAFARTDVVRAELGAGYASGVDIVDDGGADVPCVVEATSPERTVVSFVASEVPGMGWRTWWARPSSATQGWSTVLGTSIANEYFDVTASARRGGGLSSIREIATGRELIRHGEIGNELRVYDEYDQHPEFGEGPWHLVPTGAVISSADTEARTAVVQHSPAAQRIVVTGTVGDVVYEQRATLWHGLDRLDLRTRVRDFTGSDKLLRVKFGIDIPGARPVSEVAGAVIARGFAMPETDAAVAPWTLDNPANTFFALSSTARLRLRDASGARLSDAAIAIAEVVVDGPENAAPHARDLVIAMARVGVTATTSTAAGTRYGWLHVDSNLPDVRIVLGGPDTNPLAAEILDAAGEEFSEELKRQLADTGAARVYVPPTRPVEESWVANADLRGPRALPAVIIAGADAGRLGAEIASFAAEFAEHTVADVTAIDGGSTTPLDSHTVGVLSNGMPGFAVDTSGGMHLSLMRSCTGWPSGVWLDPPQRRAPDGSAFQLQHWTHDFEYALVSGEGDWRSSDLVAHGQGFSNPLRVRVGAATGGRLPARHCLLTVIPERRVQVSTVKPTGNPSAFGWGTAKPASDGVTVRLVETTGRPVTATVASHFGWDGGHELDLLESTRRGALGGDGVLTFDLDGSQIATVSGRPSTSEEPGDRPLGAVGEVTQPVYSRYWLHNRGPAPAGFLPISIAATPTVLTVADGAVETEVTIASQYTDRDFASTLTVDAPDGWAAEPATRPVALPPDGHAAFPVTLTPPPDAAPGLYFARLRVDSGPDTVEDVVSVLIPGASTDAILPPAPGEEIDHQIQIKGTTAETGRALGLDITSVSDPITLSPGGTARVSIGLSSSASTRIEGEAMPVSPWGTWDFIGPYSQPFAVEAGATSEVAFDVAVPVDAAPGHWWVMVKLMWYGRVMYAPAIRLEVN